MSRRSLPLGLIGMLGLVVAIEGVLSSNGKLTTDLAETWRIKGREAAQEAVSCDLLCFGDSLVEFSILPKVLEERLHLRAYNFALPGGTPASSYFLLKRAVEAGARPRSVVVDFMPFQLDPPTHLEDARQRTWPELASLRDAIDLARTSRDIDVATRIGLAKLLTSYRARLEIRTAIHSQLHSKSRVEDDDRIFLSQWNRRNNRGAMVMPPQNRQADTGELHSDLERTRQDPNTVPYVDRFLELANAQGITVYWIIPPISPEYQASSITTGSATHFTTYVSEKTAQYANIITVDGRQSQYKPEVFCDALHLNRTGATSFTNDLADIIAQPRSSSAWVKLPTYHDYPACPSVEDVGESIIAIRLDRRSVKR